MKGAGGEVVDVRETVGEEGGEFVGYYLNVERRETLLHGGCLR